MKLCCESDLQTLSDNVFITNCNLLFETSPTLTNKLLAKRPLFTFKQVIDAAEQLMFAETLQNKVEILNAHPRIGAPIQSMSAISQKEQGPETGMKETLERLKILNEEYEHKFGFKYVVFVNGRPRGEIVKDLERRVQNTAEQELETGLKAMILIANDRLLKYQ